MKIQRYRINSRDYEAEAVEENIYGAEWCRVEDVEKLEAELLSMRCCGNCDNYLFDDIGWCVIAETEADGDGKCEKWKKEFASAGEIE